MKGIKRKLLSIFMSVLPDGYTLGATEKVGNDRLNMGTGIVKIACSLCTAVREDQEKQAVLH